MAPSMTLLIQVLGDGLLGSISQVAVLAGALILVLMLVGLGGAAYKHLRGGIEWPDEKQASEDEVSRGEDGDEWKYY